MKKILLKIEDISPSIFNWLCENSRYFCYLIADRVDISNVKEFFSMQKSDVKVNDRFVIANNLELEFKRPIITYGLNISAIGSGISFEKRFNTAIFAKNYSIVRLDYSRITLGYK
jgi:hypothetical protein